MIHRFRTLALMGGTSALIALSAQAQTAAPAPSGHTDHATAAAVPSGSTEAFKAAMDRMHKGMMTAPTGNTDVDFVRGMIPHHQGAIDMARIQLQFGTDPALRRMAEDIIAAQEKEIATMQAWLDRNAPGAAGTEPPAANPATGAPPAARPGDNAPAPTPKPAEGSPAPAAAPASAPAPAPAPAPDGKPAN